MGDLGVDQAPPGTDEALIDVGLPRATGAHLVCDVELADAVQAAIGRLEDAFGRCFWDVLYHPATGTGRLVRGFPKAKRGVMGEILDERD